MRWSSAHVRQLPAALLLAGCVITLTAWIAASFPGNPLLPSLGASAVLVAALPDSPLARPWAVLGGSLLSLLVSYLLVRLLAGHWLAAPLAVMASLAVMLLLRCLHPPGGAVALLTVLGINHGNFHSLPQLLWAMLPGLLILLIIRQLWRRQPAAPPSPHATQDPLPSQRSSPSAEDWRQTLRRHATIVDASPDQLQQLYRELGQHLLQQRTQALRLADIMSRNLVTLAPSDLAETAWRLLRSHKVKLLPVVQDERLIGVLSMVDILKRIDATHSLERLLQQSVSTFMQTEVRTQPPELAVASIVPLLSDEGMHHLPIVDHSGKLVGMVTQSDLIAALSQLVQTPSSQ